MTMACLVLASGLSRRFGDADKLMEPLDGKPLLAHCLITAREAFDLGHRYVVAPDVDPRAHLAFRHGFNLIANPDPATGQGRSLALGVSALLDAGYDSACILLGDVPFVTGKYLRALMARSEAFEICFSLVDDREQPPAIFRNEALRKLTELTGDKGARSADLSGFSIGHQNLPAKMAQSYDTQKDFKISSN